LREGLAVCDRLNPKSPQRYLTASLLGAALTGQKKYAEAEPLLVDSATLFKANAAQFTTAAQQKMVQDTVQRVIDLYDAWDRPEDAARWRKELETLQRAPGAK
jgi:hypothetical protein